MQVVRSCFVGVVLVALSCGGRTGIERQDEQLTGGAGGQPGNGRAGTAAVPRGGEPAAGGASGTAGTATGGLGTCQLAPGDCATAAEPACQASNTACVGAFLAQVRLTSDAELVVTDLAVHSDDRVALAGHFRGTVNLGEHVLSSPPRPHAPSPTAAFVASFDASGKPQWAYAYEGMQEYQATGLDFAPNGDLVMQASTFYDAEPSAVVVRLSPQGEPLWSKAWGHAGHVMPQGVRVDLDGRIWLSGTLRQTLDFPGLMLATKQDTSAYVLRLNASGDGQQAFSIAASSWYSSKATDLELDAENNLLVTGEGQTMPGQYANFFEKYSPAGKLVFSKSFAGRVDLAGVAVDSKLRATIFGHFTEQLSNEGQTFQSPPDDSRAWIAQYTPTGQLAWQKAYDGEATAAGLTTDPFGNLILTGGGALVFQGKPLASSHAVDRESALFSFVLKLRPDGSEVWARTIDGDVRQLGLGTDRAGNTWLGSNFQGPVWVGSTKLATDRAAGLLVKLSP